MNRRSFVHHGVSGLLFGLGIVTPEITTGKMIYQDERGTKKPHPTYPRQEPDRVREVVGASHGNLSRVKELITASPALAKASWDWGFGDWESALGAASHTGQQEIAYLLLEHGARPTMFSAAMLGQLPIVRAFIEASPGIQKTLGPHSITLLSHARAGGESAREVVQYLEAVGHADAGPKMSPLSEDEMKGYIGSYEFGPDSADRFEVFAQRGMLMLKRVNMTPRRLFHLGNHEFHPAGAEAVRIRFSWNGSQGSSLTVNDAGIVLSATRV